MLTRDEARLHVVSLLNEACACDALHQYDRARSLRVEAEKLQRKLVRRERPMRTQP